VDFRVGFGVMVLESLIGSGRNSLTLLCIYGMI
jgi:hypothetical protein